MFKQISHIGVWVNDQDEALAFYRDKLGLEVRMDVTREEMGMRWLSMGVPGQDLNFVLLNPDALPFEDETALGLVKDTLATGYNPPLIFDVDDCRATVEELRERGVDITQEPEEYFYGVDAGIRDPFGNSMRVVQRAPVPA